MLNYTLDKFHSPFLVQLYYWIITAMVLINLLAFGVMCYVIVQHGRILEVYRWLLLCNSFLSYILDVALALAHGIGFLPATIFYFDGILGRYLDGQILVCALLTILATKSLLLYVIQFYRFAMSFPGPLQEFMGSNRNLVIVVGGHAMLGLMALLILGLDNEVIYCRIGSGIKRGIFEKHQIFGLSYVLSCFKKHKYLKNTVSISNFKNAYDYIDAEVPALKNIELGLNVTYLPRNLKLQLLIWTFIATMGVILIFGFKFDPDLNLNPYSHLFNFKSGFN